LSDFEAAWLSAQPGKPEPLRTKALALIRERYWDFGPSLAAEKLHEVHPPGKQPVRFRAPCHNRRSGAALRMGSASALRLFIWV
jgi:hypothetical protein